MNIIEQINDRRRIIQTHNFLSLLWSILKFQNIKVYKMQIKGNLFYKTTAWNYCDILGDDMEEISRYLFWNERDNTIRKIKKLKKLGL